MDRYERTNIIDIRGSKTYIHQLCVEYGYRLEELTTAMSIRTDGERESKKSVLSTLLYDDDDDDDDDDDLIRRMYQFTDNNNYFSFYISANLRTMFILCVMLVSLVYIGLSFSSFIF